MADLILRVKAEYDSAIKCKEELEKVEAELKKVNENTSPKEIARLTQKYAELSVKWQNGLSNIGKMGYYCKDAFSKIGNAVKGVTKDIEDNENSNKSLYSTLVKRLEVEKKISEETTKQKEKAQAQLNTAKEGYNRNKETYDKLNERMSTKYGGKAEGFWSEKDQKLMERGRESLRNWGEEVKNRETQVEVLSSILQKSEERLEEYKAKLSDFQLPQLDLKSNIDDLVEQIAAGESKIDDLKGRLASLYGELNERTDFQGAKNKMYDLYDEIESKKKEIDDLQQQVDGFSISNLVNQQQTLSVYAGEVAEKMQKEDDAIASLKSQQEGLNEQSAMYKSIQDSIDLHMTEREKYAQILDATNKSIEDTKNKIESETKAHADHQQKIKELTNDVSGLNAEYERQKEIVNDTDANKAAISGVKEEIVNTKKSIDQTIDSTEKLKDVLGKVDEAYKNGQEFYKGYVGGSYKKGARVYTNEDEYNMANALDVKSLNLQSQISDGARNGMAEEDLKALQDELTETQRKFGVLDEKARETAMLLGGELAPKAEAMTQRLFEANKAVEEAEKSYNSLNNELEREKSILVAIEENSDNQKTIADQKQKVDELTSALNEQAEAVANAKAEQIDAQKEIEHTSGELGDALEDLKDKKGVFDDFEKAISYLPAPLQRAAGGVKGVGRAMSLLAKNPLMIALSGLILILQSVWKWFNKSAEGQRAFAKISGYVGGIITRLEEVVVKFGGTVFNVIKNIVKAISSPKQAIKSVMDFLAAQVKNRLKGVVNAFVGAGETIANVFVDLWESIKKGKLDFSNTQKSLKKVLDGVLAIGTGVNNMTDKISNAANATVEWVKQTHNVAMESKKIAEEERELGLEIEANREKTLKLQKSMAELQATMRNTNLSKAERKKALEEYKKQVEEQAKIQRDFAEKRRSLHQRKLDLDEPDTIEEMQEQAALANAVLEADVSKQRMLTSLQRVTNSINKGESGKSSKQLNEEYKLLLNENAQKQAKEIRENGYIIEQARINAMEEGTARTIAQMKLDYKKELDAAVEYENDLKREKLKRAKEEFQKNPKNKKKVFNMAAVDVSMTEQEQNVQSSKISDAQNGYNKKLMDLSKSYQSYNEKQEQKELDYHELRNLLSDKMIEKSNELAKLQQEMNTSEGTQKEILQKQISDREKELDILERRKRILEATYKTQDEELIAMRNFLKEYGTYDQKTQAIKDSYADRIAKAKAEGNSVEVVTLEQQQEKELSSLRLEKAKATMDWEGLFNDLGSYSAEYLKGIRGQLADLLKDPNIRPDEAKVITENMEKIDSVVNQKLGNTFHWINEYLVNQKRLQDEAALAAKEYAKALSEQMDAEKSLSIAQSNVYGMFSGEQVDKLTDSGINIENITQKKDNVFSILGIDKTSEQGKKLSEALKNLTTEELRAAAAANKSANALAKKTNAEEKSDGQKWREKIAGLVKGFADDVQKYLGDLPNLLGSIGLGDVGDKVGKGLSGINDAAGAAADFASGNYVGAVFKGISAIKNFGSALGIGGGNEKEVAETTERLTKQNESLQYAIESLTETLGNSYGGKALTAYTNALEKQENINKNQMEILKTQMGYHSAHHSNEYYADDNEIRKYNKQAQEAMKTAGVEISTITGLQSIYNLTPEQLKAIRDFAPDLWKYLTEVGKYDKSEYWDAVVDQAGKTKELTEQIMEIMTTTTDESVFSQFLSQLKELSKNSSDVFSNMAVEWQEMVNDMVVNNFVGDEYQEKLKEWREKIYKLNKKFKEQSEGGMTMEEYKKALAALEEEYRSYVKEAQGELNIYKEAGIVSDPSEKSSQSATANGIKEVSYEQASSIVGILTAGQIIWEQQKNEQTMLNANILDLTRVATEQRDISDDSREILAGMAIHVEEIRDGMVDVLLPKIKSMDSTLSNIERYVKEQ